MGIFKDLGFTNRNGEVEVPNAETIAGLSIEEFKNSFLPPKIVNDADSLIQISGSVLPKTITQESGQSNWVKYQATVKHNIVSFNKTIYSNAPAAGDWFGRSCAIGSTFMLIGSYGDDDKGSNAGKVEMFDLNGNYIKTLYSNAPSKSDRFGVSCAIGATFILIGSYYDDDNGTDAGKVEMFDLNGNFIKTIYSNQPDASDFFGYSCAIGSTFMLVGSFGDDDKGADTGKVEMFDLNGDYIKTLYGNQPAEEDRFGISCAIGSTFMLIGSYLNDDKGADTGKVEMFDLNGDYIKTLYSNQPAEEDRFGISCAIGATFILIGSYYDADKGVDAGKVEMFDLNGNYIKTIYSNQPAEDDLFGASCAIGATFMLVGSYGDADKGAAAGKVEMFAIDTTKPTLTINNVVQTEESSSLTETIYKAQMVNTNTLTISSTGSIESVDINTYILE